MCEIKAEHKSKQREVKQPIWKALLRDKTAEKDVQGLRAPDGGKKLKTELLAPKIKHSILLNGIAT